MKHLLYIVLFLPFFASCEIGLPASIGGKGSPGIYMSMKNFFESSGQKSFLGEFFDIDTIKNQIKNSDAKAENNVSGGEAPVLWNYIYNQIEIADGIKVSGVPGDNDAVQTYLMWYPVIGIPIPSPVPIQSRQLPVIEFSAPSFNTMLETLNGIQFKSVYCYIIVEGITNTVSNPASITIGTETNSTQYLPQTDLLPPNFADNPGDDFTKPINASDTKTSTNSGFDITPLFNTPQPKPLRISITNVSAEPVNGEIKIAVKMLFVLPLRFEVPPEIKNGSPEYIRVKDSNGTIKNWVKLELGQLDGIAGTDISAISKSVQKAEFRIYEIKNNILSGISLAFYNEEKNEWLPDIINLNNENGGTVDISGISTMPKMTLITEAKGGKGEIKIPPAEYEDGKLKSEFDFSIAITVRTDFEGAFDL